jgi:hypothetical protein
MAVILCCVISVQPAMTAGITAQFQNQILTAEYLLFFAEGVFKV